LIWYRHAMFLISINWALHSLNTSIKYFFVNSDLFLRSTQHSYACCIIISYIFQTTRAKMNDNDYIIIQLCVKNYKLIFGCLSRKIKRAFFVKDWTINNSLLVLIFYVHHIINNDEKTTRWAPRSLNTNGGTLHSDTNDGLNDGYTTREQ